MPEVARGIRQHLIDLAMIVLTLNPYNSLLGSHEKTAEIRLELISTGPPIVPPFWNQGGELLEQPPMTAAPPFAPWRVMVKTQSYEIDVTGPVPAIVMNWLEQLLEFYSGKKLTQ